MYVTITPVSRSTWPTALSAMKRGISATSGTICTAKITTTNAACRRSGSARARAPRGTRARARRARRCRPRLFLTLSQKCGRPAASEFARSAVLGIHCGVAEHVDAGLERRRHHPVDGERHHDEDEQAGQVERDPLRDLPAAASAAGAGWATASLDLPDPHHLADVDERDHEKHEHGHERRSPTRARTG